MPRGPGPVNGPAARFTIFESLFGQKLRVFVAIIFILFEHFFLDFWELFGGFVGVFFVIFRTFFGVFSDKFSTLSRIFLPAGSGRSYVTEWTFNARPADLFLNIFRTFFGDFPHKFSTFF